MSSDLLKISSPPVLRPSAFELSLAEWKSWCQSQGAAPFVGQQVYQWIYQKGERDPTRFSNLPLPLRQALSETFDWELLAIDSVLASQDGSEKLLLKTHDKLLLEMVWMPYDNRSTLCISSQVGCKMGCTFCQTGKMGFKRNLTSGEILSQILLANSRSAEKVTNIVFMGMGEPLDNYNEVIKACSTMIDPLGLGLSATRVTISTSGLVPEIEKLGKDLPVRLAISLHTADEEKRSQMMPINRTYSLEALKEALLRYPASKRHGITFEYVMIEGQNDSIQDAKKLVRFLHGLKSPKVNLIPVNHFPGVEIRASHAERIRAFQSYLSERSIPAPVRYSRGQDVSGGCGQLAAKRESELHLDPRVVSRLRRQTD